MPEDVRDYIETKTVASLLGRWGWTNDEGNVAFTAPKSDLLSVYDVIAIDEYSMLSDKDVKTLLDCDTHIIFAGDPKQLAPVMAQKGDFEDVEVFELTEQMRQAGVIHRAAEACREEAVFPTESDGPLTVHNTTDDALKAFLSALSEEIEQEENEPLAATLSYRWLAQKNVEVVEVGEQARNVVLNSPAHSFVPDEYLLLYDSCQAGYNGQIVKVLEVQPFTKINHTYAWESYSIRVEGERGQDTIAVTSPADFLKVEEYVGELSKQIRQLKKDKKFEELKPLVGEVEYLNKIYTKVGRPYACTIHKSQGQSIPHVWVSTNNFGRGGDKRALLYVALSRASETLHTVLVEEAWWKVREAYNAIFRAVKAEWEVVFNEPHWKYKLRHDMKATSYEDKGFLSLYMGLNLEVYKTYINLLPHLVKV